MSLCIPASVLIQQVYDGKELIKGLCHSPQYVCAFDAVQYCTAVTCPAVIDQRFAVCKTCTRASCLLTQVLAYKLGDAKRLVGFVMASPDAGVHHHKSKLEGDAYQVR